MAQQVKNLPAMQETWVRSLSWEDPLKKGKATHADLECSDLENSMDCIVHRVAKSRAQLSDFHFSLIQIIPLTFSKLNKETRTQELCEEILISDILFP